mmetsp:Transcript_23436/g.64903  ORF Transcript_23436/g.64903 Transcript_23436/m.64903 type:complete len:208 (-) Transcript_23436:64-687(-)
MCCLFCWAWTLAASLATCILFFSFLAIISASSASLSAFAWAAKAAFRSRLSCAAFSSCKAFPSTTMMSWSTKPMASGVSSPLSCVPLCVKKACDCSKPKRLQTEPIRILNGVERRNWMPNSLPRTSLISSVICSPYLASFNSCLRCCCASSASASWVATGPECSCCCGLSCTRRDACARQPSSSRPCTTPASKRHTAQRIMIAAQHG